MRIFGFLLLFMSLAASGQENWLVDNKGCKVFNPYPRKREAVEWTGDCIDGVANGYGQLTWLLNGKKTNNVYTGIMINGRPEGKGKYETVTIIPQIFEGEFHNGELSSGKIVSYFKNDTVIYVGDIKNWKANGIGVMHFSDRVWFKGTFKDDYFKEGIYTEEKLDYTIESANWKFNNPEDGKITWSDGTIYEGEIKRFEPHGIGTVTYPDGISEYGIWKNGELIRHKINGM